MSEAKDVSIGEIKPSGTTNTQRSTRTSRTGTIGMMQDALINNPDLSQEMKERANMVYAKDSWVHADLKGNVIIPQTRIGYTLYTLDALLNSIEESDNPAAVLNQFNKSRLTYDQRKEAGRVMSAVHHAKGIKVATVEHQRTYDYPEDRKLEEGITHDKIVPPGRFEELWRDAKVGCERQLENFIRLTSSKHGSTPKISEFFTDPQYAIQKKELIDVVAMAVEILHSDGGKQLTRNFREALDYRYVPEEILHPQLPSHKDPDFKAKRDQYFDNREKQPIRQAVGSIYEGIVGEPLQNIKMFMLTVLGKKFPQLSSFHENLIS